jgi:hypothetical protein
MTAECRGGKIQLIRIAKKNDPARITSIAKLQK